VTEEFEVSMIKLPWLTLRHQVHQDKFSFIVCERGLF